MNTVCRVHAVTYDHILVVIEASYDDRSGGVEQQLYEPVIVHLKEQVHIELPELGVSEVQAFEPGG